MPLVFISFIMDGVLSKKLKDVTSLVYGEFSVWNDIFEGKVDSDLIIIGSSRAWVHFNPTMITEETGISAYNIGMDGHPFFLQNARYTIFRKYNRKPKLVIVSLETNSFFKRSDLYNSSQFLPYLREYKEDLKKPLMKFKGFNKYDFDVPLVRYYANVNIFKDLFLGSNSKTIRVKGFQARDEIWNNDLLEAKQKYESIKVQIDTTTLNLFKDFILKNKKENIEVILVYSPEYIEGQEFISNRDSILNMYKKISEEYKIRFIDFSKDSISYKKEYFYNSTHMNKVGANMFTNQLIDSLKINKP